MAQTTWAEIERQQTGSANARHKKHHEQPIESIVSPAQKNLDRLKLPELFGDAIFRFRLGGSQRLWGFRQGAIFHVVWWDPDHNVYPAEPT